nr:Fic family protein [Eubacterium sp.]
GQTQDILNNVNVQKLTPNEIGKVFCLRDTWKYLLENIEVNLDLVFLENIHELVARFDVDYRYLGKIRYDDVMISGTNWRPDLPDVDNVFYKLESFKEINNITERALKTGLWIMRTQIFKDGNKRVGSFAINKILIENGKGLFNVPVEKDGTFKEKLVKYYETNDVDDILEWTYENCLDGVNRIKHKETPAIEEPKIEVPKKRKTR